MLGDYKIDHFNRKLVNMVAEFGLENNNWVKDMFEKWNMWATAYIRGNFSADFRTTSRCESMHAEVGRYVNFQNNLYEFL